MISVLIVDDHDIVRAGISRLLEDESDISVVGQCSNGEDAVTMAKKIKPDVVLMDLRMPGIGGLEATKKMVRNDPNIKVIILTVFTEEPFPTRLFSVGAAGYITKGSDVSEMISAIRKVHLGGRYINPQVAQQIALKTLDHHNDSPLANLSERELQVMIMITQGQSVKDIADKLCLSPKTVNSYRYRLFDKLSVTSDVELTHLALRYGILDTETA